ncbi:MAG: undecaprenyldiphospho-muramoylpentapeptide beta-N-acetylglucosaminyltransferase [Fidelibacterota bacterium]
MKNKKIKILFAGGGTGGHLYPAVALCEEFISQLGQENVEILFIGSHYGIEKQIVPKLGYAFKPIWIRGIQRSFSWQAVKVNFLAPFRIITSFLQSLRAIKKFRPDLAIGTGGYASGPAISVAGKLGIPVFLQEQNVYPGVTTRMLAKYAKTIYVSYRDSEKYLKNIKAMGTPLRISLQQQDYKESHKKFGLSREKRTIFVFGGSQGSRAINNFLQLNIGTILKATNTQFIWQTGQGDFELIDKIHGKNPDLRIQPFIYEMDYAYSAADLVICRSGALTLAELCLFGKASILIPLPTAAGNHQEKNARSLEKKNAASVILQKELNPQLLIDKINHILGDSKIKEEMETKAARNAKPEAAKMIVKDIIETIEKNA